MGRKAWQAKGSQDTSEHLNVSFDPYNALHTKVNSKRMTDVNIKAKTILKL